MEFKLGVSVNHYIKPRAFLMNGKPKISIYETSEAKLFKKQFIKYIKEEIEKQNFNVILDKYKFTHIDTTWYFPRTNMDSNNNWKLTLDCLTEAGIWVDDNTALERCKRIYYDSKNPRFVMEIYYSDFIGIFDNQSHLDEFKSKCIQCNKYNNGKCSILNKAMIGKIQSEIQDFSCTEYKEKRK